MSYALKIKDPRWQKKRLEILNRDNFKCRFCMDTESTLNVHHLAYVGEPWEAPNCALITLCEDCHEQETKDIREAETMLIRQLKLVGFSSITMKRLADCFIGDLNWSTNEPAVTRIRDFIDMEVKNG